MIALVWTGPALGDLASIRDYLNEQAGARVSADVVNSVIEVSERLAQFPHRGRPGRVSGTRELVFGRYVIAYRVRDQELEILRVLHGARRWPARL